MRIERTCLPVPCRIPCGSGSKNSKFKYQKDARILGKDAAEIAIPGVVIVDAVPDLVRRLDCIRSRLEYQVAQFHHNLAHLRRVPLKDMLHAYNLSREVLLTH